MGPAWKVGTGPAVQVVGKSFVVKLVFYLFYSWWWFDAEEQTGQAVKASC